MAKPEGKHLFGTVRVGEKGQIVIPKEAREIFHIKPGDSLVVLGDEATGIAILKHDVFLTQVSNAIFHKQDRKTNVEADESNGVKNISPQELEELKQLIMAQREE